MIRCNCNFTKDTTEIWVDDQHLSRLNGREVRELIVQLLVFGGSDLRRDIGHWLSGGKLDELGRYIAPDVATQPINPGLDAGVVMQSNHEQASEWVAGPGSPTLERYFVENE